MYDFIRRENTGAGYANQRRKGGDMKMSSPCPLRLGNWITGTGATLQNVTEFFKICSHSCFSWRTNVVYTAQGYAVAL